MEIGCFSVNLLQPLQYHFHVGIEPIISDNTKSKFKQICDKLFTEISQLKQICQKKSQ